MDILSIRELRQEAGPAPATFRVHAQAEAVLRKTTKKGDPYFELKLVDADDALVLRAWSNTAAFDACAAARARDFFAVTGEFFQNADRGTLDAREFSLEALDDAAVDALLAGSAELRARQDADYAFIVETVGAIGDPRLRALCGAFLEQFGERFRRTAAARRNHHARRGGLVEHVAQMMRSAAQICVAYPTLNRDLLASGVLFHDVGKLWENAYVARGFTMPHSEASELISHIPVGMEIVNRLWRDLIDSDAAADWLALEPSSDRVRLHLLHLIASHHGELQFGSPVVPKTPEAFALHYIDNLDAKLQMVFEAYEKAPELGKGVFEKVWPLPGNLVGPLEAFAAAAEEAGGGEAANRLRDEAPPAREEDPEPESEADRDGAGESEAEPADQLPIAEPDFGDEPLPDFESGDPPEEEEPF